MSITYKKKEIGAPFLKDLIRCLDRIQNGANVHQVRNLVCILQCYCDLIEKGTIHNSPLDPVLDKILIILKNNLLGVKL